ncbi:6-hydroxymethylpterin diphosphokinase MptE-like protein [uncultured Helicobacter sp.]|uniref:motility associated factor glycosyltransferase family protein n=1 Tax=uncultured Helicobacter sp. TaxID=175537 RepID=UPI002638EE82|nr:6-hydroxymethylpterin diphosphokinase MptE-like protein [uncultured Helicobacter sp.]
MRTKQSIVEILQNSSPQEIESFCNARFQSNLTFFKEANYPNLFEVLQTPAKEYQLYIGQEGVNIINFKQNTLMYAITEGKSTMLEVHKNCAYNPPINEKWNRIFGGKPAFIDDTFPYSQMLINEVLNYALNNGSIAHYHLPSDFLPSLNLFGLGGGIFLQILIENYATIHNFFIFEESLDLFRIACFFVDFALLFSKTQNQAGYIFLESIMKKEYIQNFFLTRKISTSLIRFELMLYQTPITQNARNIVFEVHSQTMRGWGTFEDEMRGIKNKLSLPIKKMLIKPKRVNAPICVVANGPSLDFLLPFIKKNKDRMIIFSCGTALKPLLNYGIKPDFQIEIERHDYLGDVLKSAPLDNIPLIAASVLDENAKKVAKELYVFEREGSSAANLNAPRFKVQFTAPLVGNAGAALASYLGSDVILCGLDCGYKKGASKHAKNSYYGEEDTKIPEDAYPVTGNFSDDIYSDALFSLSKATLEEAFRSLKPFHILNLNDGAKINGALPTHHEEFELKTIDKKTVLKQLKSLFKDPHKEDFYTKETQKYIFEILAFKNKMHDVFKAQVFSKQELFIALDKGYGVLAKETLDNAFISILFGGTLSHFLYAIAFSALHLPHNNMQNLWEKSGELYLTAMDKMLESLRETLFSKSGTPIA